MNEGLPVKGYQPQSDAKVELVNINKEVEENVLRILDNMSTVTEIDQRWLAIGRTKIEEGFMAINRAVFRPQRIKFEDE